MPYLLSNLDLVTESFTLIAGNSSLLAAGQLVEPGDPDGGLLADPAEAAAATRVKRRPSAARLARRTSSIGSWSPSWHLPGPSPAASNSTPLCTRKVSVAAVVDEQVRARSPSNRRIVHCQYSGSVSPFQANTGTPLGRSTVPCGPTTTAAAASSWVEKTLQDTQRTSAPSATSVSMRTAVCTVMCSEPAIRAPCSGCVSAYSRRKRHQPGHLVLGEADLVPAEVGQAEVGDGERKGRGHGHGEGHPLRRRRP